MADYQKEILLRNSLNDTLLEVCLEPSQTSLSVSKKGSIEAATILLSNTNDGSLLPPLNETPDSLGCVQDDSSLFPVFCKKSSFKDRSRNHSLSFSENNKKSINNSLTVKLSGINSESKSRSYLESPSIETHKNVYKENPFKKPRNRRGKVSFQLDISSDSSQLNNDSFEKFAPSIKKTNPFKGIKTKKLLNYSLNENFDSSDLIIDNIDGNNTKSYNRTQPMLETPKSFKNKNDKFSENRNPFKKSNLSRYSLSQSFGESSSDCIENREESIQESDNANCVIQNETSFVQNNVTMEDKGMYNSNKSENLHGENSSELNKSKSSNCNDSMQCQDLVTETSPIRENNVEEVSSEIRDNGFRSEHQEELSKVEINVVTDIVQFNSGSERKKRKNNSITEKKKFESEIEISTVEDVVAANNPADVTFTVVNVERALVQDEVKENDSAVSLDIDSFDPLINVHKQSNPFKNKKDDEFRKKYSLCKNIDSFNASREVNENAKALHSMTSVCYAKGSNNTELSVETFKNENENKLEKNNPFKKVNIEKYSFRDSITLTENLDDVGVPNALVIEAEENEMKDRTFIISVNDGKMVAKDYDDDDENKLLEASDNNRGKDTYRDINQDKMSSKRHFSEENKIFDDIRKETLDRSEIKENEHLNESTTMIAPPEMISNCNNQENITNEVELSNVTKMITNEKVIPFNNLRKIAPCGGKLDISDSFSLSSYEKNKEDTFQEKVHTASLCEDIVVPDKNPMYTNISSFHATLSNKDNPFKIGRKSKYSIDINSQCSDISDSASVKDDSLIKNKEDTFQEEVHTASLCEDITAPDKNPMYTNISSFHATLSNKDNPFKRGRKSKYSIDINSQCSDISDSASVKDDSLIKNKGKAELNLVQLISEEPTENIQGENLETSQTNFKDSSKSDKYKESTVTSSVKAEIFSVNTSNKSKRVNNVNIEDKVEEVTKVAHKLGGVINKVQENKEDTFQEEVHTASLYEDIVVPDKNPMYTNISSFHTTLSNKDNPFKRGRKSKYSIDINSQCSDISDSASVKDDSLIKNKGKAELNLVELISEEPSENIQGENLETSQTNFKDSSKSDKYKESTVSSPAEIFSVNTSNTSVNEVHKVVKVVENANRLIKSSDNTKISSSVDNNKNLSENEAHVNNKLIDQEDHVQNIADSLSCDEVSLNNDKNSITNSENNSSLDNTNRTLIKTPDNGIGIDDVLMAISAVEDDIGCSRNLLSKEITEDIDPGCLLGNDGINNECMPAKLSESELINSSEGMSFTVGSQIQEMFDNESSNTNIRVCSGNNEKVTDDENSPGKSVTKNHSDIGSEDNVNFLEKTTDDKPSMLFDDKTNKTQEPLINEELQSKDLLTINGNKVDTYEKSDEFAYKNSELQKQVGKDLSVTFKDIAVAIVNINQFEGVNSSLNYSEKNEQFERRAPETEVVSKNKETSDFAEKQCSEELTSVSNKDKEVVSSINLGNNVSIEAYSELQKNQNDRSIVMEVNESHDSETGGSEKCNQLKNEPINQGAVVSINEGNKSDANEFSGIRESESNSPLKTAVKLCAQKKIFASDTGIQTCKFSTSVSSKTKKKSEKNESFVEKVVDSVGEMTNEETKPEGTHCSLSPEKILEVGVQKQSEFFLNRESSENCEDINKLEPNEEKAVLNEITPTECNPHSGREKRGDGKTPTKKRNLKDVNSIVNVSDEHKSERRRSSRKSNTKLSGNNEDNMPKKVISPLSHENNKGLRQIGSKKILNIVEENYLKSPTVTDRKSEETDTTKSETILTKKQARNLNNEKRIHTLNKENNLENGENTVDNIMHRRKSNGTSRSNENVYNFAELSSSFDISAIPSKKLARGERYKYKSTPLVERSLRRSRRINSAVSSTDKPASGRSRMSSENELEMNDANDSDPEINRSKKKSNSQNGFIFRVPKRVPKKSSISTGQKSRRSVTFRPHSSLISPPADDNMKEDKSFLLTTDTPKSSSVKRKRSKSDDGRSLSKKNTPSTPPTKSRAKSTNHYLTPDSKTSCESSLDVSVIVHTTPKTRKTSIFTSTPKHRFSIKKAPRNMRSQFSENQMALPSSTLYTTSESDTGPSGVSSSVTVSRRTSLKSSVAHADLISYDSHTCMASKIGTTTIKQSGIRNSLLKKEKKNTKPSIDPNLVNEEVSSCFNRPPDSFCSTSYSEQNSSIPVNKSVQIKKLLQQSVILETHESERSFRDGTFQMTLRSSRILQQSTLYTDTQLNETGTTTVHNVTAPDKSVTLISKFSKKRKQEDSIFKEPEDLKIVKKKIQDPLPKLAKPAKWIKRELYTFLQKKLNKKYPLEKRYLSERLVIMLYNAVNNTLMGHSDLSLPSLKAKLNDYNICNTQLEFYTFLHRFTPFAFIKNFIPMGRAYGNESFRHEPIKCYDPIQ